MNMKGNEAFLADWEKYRTFMKQEGHLLSKSDYLSFRIGWISAVKNPFCKKRWIKANENNLQRHNQAD